MNPLIGNNSKAKLILLSIDDDSQEPTKSNLRRFFPGAKINLYMANGRHKWSFWELESIINIIKNGAKSHNMYGRQIGIITHVIKLDPEILIDEFFLLTYSESIVAILNLTDKCLEKAKALIQGIGKANREIESITDCVDRFDQVRKNIAYMSLKDSKIENPDQKAIDSLFTNYGNEAQIQMTEFAKKWLDKRMCI